MQAARKKRTNGSLPESAPRGLEKRPARLGDTEEERPMNTPLRPYVSLLRQSGQLERVDVSDEQAISRGFWFFFGLIAGLMLAWVLTR